MPSSRPQDWVIERGIGETRALLLDGDRVLAAKLHWPGELFAGQVMDARLTAKAGGARRGVAITQSGCEILVDHLPAKLNEGEEFPLIITRAAIAEKGRFKQAQGRVVTDLDPARKQWLAGAQDVHRFTSGSWEEIWQTASAGHVEFPGGTLHFSTTPAMTLIDIDGEGPPRELAMAALPAIAYWVQAFDLGGSIGIDFPTIEAKADRKSVDAALEDALAGWSHERTAMNGFGFVQIVARLDGPSLLHRFAASRVGMCARMALRMGELAEGTGHTLLLTIHPALKAKLKDDWLTELARRTGKQVRIEIDPGLALEAPQAQIVSA